MSNLIQQQNQLCRAFSGALHIYKANIKSKKVFRVFLKQSIFLKFITSESYKFQRRSLQTLNDLSIFFSLGGWHIFDAMKT